MLVVIPSGDSGCDNIGNSCGGSDEGGGGSGVSGCNGGS